jgi:indole-3-glycerol phosphate synthase
VLLIVAALERSELRALYDEATELSLDVLVEVHDAAELEVALGLGAEIIGVNNRDLRDFSVELERTFELLDAMGPDTIVVAESGINSAAHLARLGERGVHAALIGERLMRAQDPAAALAALISGSQG